GCAERYAVWRAASGTAGSAQLPGAPITLLRVPEAPPAPPGEAHVPVDDELTVVTAPAPAPVWREALAIGIVALVVAIPLRGLFRAPGPPMEEGFMLVFPERVLHGDIPNRDFLYLY